MDPMDYGLEPIVKWVIVLLLWCTHLFQVKFFFQISSYFQCYVNGCDEIMLVKLVMLVGNIFKVFGRFKKRKKCNDNYC